MQHLDDFFLVFALAVAVKHMIGAFTNALILPTRP
jgi:hypothetical protein